MASGNTLVIDKRKTRELNAVYIIAMFITIPAISYNLFIFSLKSEGCT